MSSPIEKFLTTEQVANWITLNPDIEGEATAWRVRRLYELKILKEPQRCGHIRMISPDDLPEIVDAMRRRGYLPQEAAAE